MEGHHPGGKAVTLDSELKMWKEKVKKL